MYDEVLAYFIHTAHRHFCTNNRDVVHSDNFVLSVFSVNYALRVSMEIPEHFMTEDRKTVHGTHSTHKTGRLFTNGAVYQTHIKSSCRSTSTYCHSLLRYFSVSAADVHAYDGMFEGNFNICYSFKSKQYHSFGEKRTLTSKDGFPTWSNLGRHIDVRYRKWPPSQKTARKNNQWEFYIGSTEFCTFDVLDLLLLLNLYELCWQRPVLLQTPTEKKGDDDWKVDVLKKQTVPFDQNWTKCTHR